MNSNTFTCIRLLSYICGSMYIATTFILMHNHWSLRPDSTIGPLVIILVRHQLSWHLWRRTPRKTKASVNAVQSTDNHSKANTAPHIATTTTLTTAATTLSWSTFHRLLPIHWSRCEARYWTSPYIGPDVKPDIRLIFHVHLGLWCAVKSELSSTRVVWPVSTPRSLAS